MTDGAATSAPWPAEQRSARRDALLAWYARSTRGLPWRTTDDPYRILVSEVMCQQTQASRVVPRYERFVARFPDVTSLADAAPSEVLAEWSGLGYNRRALNLHRAAQWVKDRGWPTSVDGLQQLPGVGPYTAAAVACFAFGAQVPAVDTNLRRVLGRWAGATVDRAALRDLAAAEIAPGRAADWNQALMDLGATVCTPTQPDCGACPVAAWCADPSVYAPPRPQGRFKGSRREARGAVLRALVESGAKPVDELDAITGLAADRVQAAVAALADDGLVVTTAAGVSLPE